VEYFYITDCSEQRAIELRSALRKSTGASLWLFLDGFTYGKIPQDLTTFKLLSTSQQVDVKSMYSIYITKILLPSWRREDIFELGKNVMKYSESEIEERYYYSGGSVREFCHGSVGEIIESVENAISVAGSNIDRCFSPFVAKGVKQVDRLRRTFVHDVSKPENYKWCQFFDQVIDSEYAVRKLYYRMSIGQLESILQWAKRSKNETLACCLFEVLIHSYGARNLLKFRV
jgi:hypothetical protein